MSVKSMYSDLPSIFSPDMGGQVNQIQSSSITLFYNSGYQFASSSFPRTQWRQYFLGQLSVEMDNLILSNVSCRYCTTFFFTFAAYSFTLNNASVSLINGGYQTSDNYYQDESQFRGKLTLIMAIVGIFGCIHIVDSALTQVDMLTNSNFTDIQGTILKLYSVYDSSSTTNIYYRIVGNTINKLAQNQDNGGAFFFQIYNPQSTLNATVSFQQNKVSNIQLAAYQSGSILKKMGGLIFIQNYNALLFNDNIVQNVYVQAYEGDIIYFLQTVSLTTSVLLQNNTIKQMAVWGTIGLIISFPTQFGPLCFSIIMGSTSITSISNSFINSYASNGYGGFLYLSSTLPSNFSDFNSVFKRGSGSYGGVLYCFNCQVITFDSSSFIWNEGQYGGVVYYASKDLNSVTEISFNRSNFTSNNIALSTSGYNEGAILSSITSNKVSVSVSLCRFTGGWLGGTMFYISQANQTLRSYVEIFNSTFDNIIAASTATLTGCIFQLLRTDLNDTKNSIYSNVICQSGGAFYLAENSSVTVNEASFINLTSYDEGGVLYSDTPYDSDYSFTDCYFTLLSAGKGAFVYDLSGTSSGTGKVKTVDGCLFEDMQSNSTEALIYMDSPGGSLLVNETLIQNVFLYSQYSSDQKASSLIEVSNGTNIKFNFITLKNFDSTDSLLETFLTVKGNFKLTITLMNSIIECSQSSAYFSMSQIGGLIFINLAKSFTSLNNTLSYCNASQDAVIKMQEVPSVTDFHSRYTFSEGASSGIFKIVSRNQTSMFSVDKCSFQRIRAVLGGVIGLQDKANMKITNSEFKYNFANNAGVVSSSLTTPLKANQMITIQTSVFMFNTALGYGGCFMITNNKMDMVISQNNLFQGNTATEGGVLSSGSINSLSISNSEFFNNSASVGQSLSIFSPYSSTKIQHCQFQTYVSFSPSLVSSSVSSQISNSTSVISIQSLTATIDSYANTYFNNYLNQHGGVYFILGATFSETNSNYYNNSAVMGGVIGCSQCSITSTGNYFSLNQASYGAVFYISDTSSLVSQFDSFKNNTAILYGGAIYSSKSTFSIKYASFWYNSADQDSAISQYISSTNASFEVSFCSFIRNRARMNTFTASNSMGSMSDCLFLDNSASQSSANLFVEYSQVKINNTKFTVTQQTITTKSNLLGSYIYISLGANVSLMNCSFGYGVARQGGAIYLSGASNLSVSNSSFLQNYAQDVGGAIYTSSYESISIIDSNFSNNGALNKGSEYFGQFSSASTLFQRVKIENSSASTSIYGDTISIRTDQLQIVGNSGWAIIGGGIYCSDCQVVEIRLSRFENLSAVLGGAIALEQSLQSKSSTNIYPTYNVNDPLTCLDNEQHDDKQPSLTRWSSLSEQSRVPLDLQQFLHIQLSHKLFSCLFRPGRLNLLLLSLSLPLSPPHSQFLLLQSEYG